MSGASVRINIVVGYKEGSLFHSCRLQDSRWKQIFQLISRTSDEVQILCVPLFWLFSATVFVCLCRCHCSLQGFIN